MFRKKCHNCGSEISKKYKYCPSCGSSTRKQEDLGMFGQDDSMEKVDSLPNPFFGGISEKMIGKMIGSTMKLLEKEMKKEMSRTKSQPKTQFKLMINGKEVNLGEQNFTQAPKEQKKPIKKSPKKLPNKTLKMGKLPRETPTANVRRLGDLVIYEINIPGVKSLKDISISQLENSIEIKAIAKDKAYLKLLPVSLPILNYNLEKDKLILELEAKN